MENFFKPKTQNSSQSSTQKKLQKTNGKLNEVQIQKECEYKIDQIQKEFTKENFRA